MVIAPKLAKAREQYMARLSARKQEALHAHRDLANLSGRDPQSLDTLVEHIATRASPGFATVWMAHIRGEDTLITLALAGRTRPTSSSALP